MEYKNWTYGKVPSFHSLLNTFHRSQRASWVLASLMLVAAILLAWRIDWRDVAQQWLYSLIVVGIVPAQYLPGLIMAMVKNRKSIDDLKESTRFGPFDKHLLRRITQDVTRSLGIMNPHVRVYITPDKEVNAMAMSLGLASFLPTYRGIYLHRQTLHIANPETLRSWIAHELGHLYPYALRSDQGLLLKLICGGLLSLWVLQAFPGNVASGVMAACAASFVFLWLVSLPRAGMGHVIEYLCDSCSLRSAGLEHSITDLLVLGREASAHYDLTTSVLRMARDGKTLSEGDALRLYEESLGYGPADREHTMDRIREAIQKRRQETHGFTWSSLYDFFWRDPSADSQAAQLRDQLLDHHRRLQKIPLLDWQQAIGWDGHSTLSMAQIERLVQYSQQRPNELWFRIPGEMNEVDSHPSCRNRVIFLWNNQREILAQAVLNENRGWY
jgi:Zn-dependent protease with chaperone function